MIGLLALRRKIALYIIIIQGTIRSEDPETLQAFIQAALPIRHHPRLHGRPLGAPLPSLAQRRMTPSREQVFPKLSISYSNSKFIEFLCFSKRSPSCLIANGQIRAHSNQLLHHLRAVSDHCIVWVGDELRMGVLPVEF